MDEREKAFSYLARVLQDNAKREAEAIAGYTVQLEAILSARAVAKEEDKDFLDTLYSDTEEKISDELNHNQSLLNEYVDFTGIPVSED